ncbi:SNF2 family DNA-dependent ATPase [Flagelloscypha sp. PMI_526]|nr:SNF2 family DNA-dependent ATPase [Flagelloscypha sp. PMI_526]
MEEIRRRMMNDPKLYPEFGTRKSAPISISSASTSSAISIDSASTSSGAYDISQEISAPQPPVKARKARPIVISSDEESGDESSHYESAKSSRQAADSTPAAPMKMPEPQPYVHPVKEHVPFRTKILNKVENTIQHHLPGVLPAARPPTGPPIPVAVPYNPYQYNPQPPWAPPSQPAPFDDDIPDLPSEHAYISPADAEKDLRDLMQGNMNEDEEVEIDEADAEVAGFREGIRLLPHQIQGRKWMSEREDASAKRYGGLLADDMGLGKTIQTLVRISDNKPRKADRDKWDPPTLIVCPLALVEQWASEIAKMVKGFTVVKHQGSSRTADPYKLKNSHVVITTYQTVQSEWTTYKSDVKDEGKGKKKKTQADDDDDGSDSSIEVTKTKKKSTGKSKDALFRVRWWRVVLDEAHNIKNRNAKTSLACCDLEAKWRWCLTGTPMQNDILELYSLLKFLRVKVLSDFHVFNEQIAKPIKNGRGATRAMKRLQAVLKGVMLRRTKTQTLNGKALIELPSRDLKIISCPFDTYEKTFYEALETRMGNELQNLQQQEKVSYISALVLLLRLRQACDHPLLVSKDYKADMEAIDPKSAKTVDGSQDGDDLADVFGQLTVTRSCMLCTTTLTEDNTDSTDDKHCRVCAKLATQNQEKSNTIPSSAKIRKTLSILKEIRDKSDGEDKTIIFSQFTSMLDLVEPFLKEEDIRFVRYDGSMQAAEREIALNKIKTVPKYTVILVSFKAGSTGLNLTSCNHVILLDLWWNPALEDQAFDRAHRFGQEKPVSIYKLKIDDTVEERILLLQDKKRELAKAALSGEKIKNLKLGMDELLALFRPGGHDEDEEDFD